MRPLESAVRTALCLALALAACERHPTPDDVARLKLADLHGVVVAFHDRNGRYPADASELRDALEQTGWGDGVLLDPWGRGFLYTYPGRRHPGAFDLCTRGPDGVPGTADDVCVLNPGAARGEPLRFGAPAS